MMARQTKTWIAGGVAALSLWGATSASAAVPVAIDPTYGTRGVVVLAQGSSVRDSEVDGAGGLYVGGTVQAGTDIYWRIEHVMSDGSFDESFAARGHLMFKAPNANAYLSGLEFNGDHLYAIGSDGAKGALVVRFRLDGEVDTTYGSRGRAAFSVKDSRLVSVADGTLLADGSVLVLGNLADPTSKLRQAGYVARLKPSGALDTSFSRDGIVVIDVAKGPLSQNLSQMEVDNKGRIVLAGSRIASAGQEMIALRYTSRGTPDSSFSGDGLFVTQPVPGAVSGISSVHVRADNSLVLGGSSRTGPITDPVQSSVVVVLTVGGRLDTSFSKDGITRVADQRFNKQVPTDIVVMADGSMIAASSPVGVEPRPVQLVRITKTGLFDSTFGKNGVHSILFKKGEKSFAQMMHVVDGDVYVLGGTQLGTTPASGAISRLTLA